MAGVEARHHVSPTIGPPVTPRQAEVLFLIAAGLQNKEIARQLGLSVATVRNHVHNILVKLGVHSKLEAASLSFRNGWVPPLHGSSDSLISPEALE
jgi:DNA-binding NarL/FixJ family response regulator